MPCGGRRAAQNLRYHDQEASSRVVRGKQYMNVGRWPLLGLVLVVSFLGHDLLMAGEVLAPRPEADLAHHVLGVQAFPGVPHAPQLHEPMPEHPENCHTAWLAVPRSDDAFAMAYQDVAAAPSLAQDAATANRLVGVVLGKEPSWPPGRRRALFQVYRI